MQVERGNGDIFVHSLLEPMPLRSGRDALPRDPAPHVQRSVSSFWRHFQGAFLCGGYPGLEPCTRDI